MALPSIVLLVTFVVSLRGFKLALSSRRISRLFEFL